MHLKDNTKLDPNYQELIVLFNARPEATTFNDPALTGNYVLHPIQQNSADNFVKQASYANNTFNIPGRTTAVFVIAKEPAPASTAVPAATDTPDTVPDRTLSIVGIIAAILALLGLGVFLRRKKA